MELNNCRVIITGAAGGIGSKIAKELAQQGAQLGLIDLRQDGLDALRDELLTTGTKQIHTVSTDLCSHEGRLHAIDQLRSAMGGFDLLINNAGVVDFNDFSAQEPALIERIYQINLVAPILLSRALLPGMIEQGHGKIVNVGSTFGSIGFAYFAAYSSSKFGMRGFSEALRRELDGTGVEVCYCAPRAVKTAANSDAVYRMAEATRMNMDEPADVAHFIVNAITQDKKSAYFGWPEKLFVRINALLPALVDNALRKQNRIMGRFTSKQA